MKNMTQNLQKLRTEIKSRLKTRKYREALEMALRNTEDQNIKDKLNKNLNYYSSLVEQLNEKKIDNSDFYYGINKIVAETLDAVDEIIGEPDDDWDFVDELTSSLKFNLVAQDDEQNYTKQHVVMTKVDNGKVSFEYEPDLNDGSEQNRSRLRIRKLYEQLNYYEQKLQETEDTKEQAKLSSIIKAININISEENKNLKV